MNGPTPRDPLFHLGPRLCLGLNRLRGSASMACASRRLFLIPRSARQSLEGSAVPGRAWDRDGCCPHILRSLLAALLFVAHTLAAEPCSPGLQPGQQPRPYSFVLATGPERGQPQCFICATGDKPAVLVFARTQNPTTGKLLQKLDQALADHKDADLHAWATFLSNDQPTLDPQLVRWSQNLGLKALPLGIFEDLAGPPSYRLDADADVTVLFFVKRKVVASLAYRADEWNDKSMDVVLGALPKILPEKP